MRLPWRRRERTEWDWALKTLRSLHIPRTTHIDDLVAHFSEHLDRKITVVPVEPVDGPVINGALEQWPDGSLAIRVDVRAGDPCPIIPTQLLSPDRYRRHVICRGLARAVYRQPAPITGLTDYTHPIEREIEAAATLLAHHLEECARIPDEPITYALTGRRPLLLR
ncbi:MAG: hypothetical protein JO362_01675 [Streptomycetaceae bacterium]|nr:hypothetical protein [Streptomycetaceae bacterium]